MTLRHKLSIVTLAASIAGAIALLMSPGPTAQAQSPGGGVTISGTIYGTLGLAPEGVPAWIGNAMVSFGNGPALIATFIDRNNSADFKKHGLSGTETISLEFLDGSGSFDIVGRFNVSQASTPGLFVLHETGYITNGKKNYANLSGRVTVQGPAVEPPPEGGVPMWISEIHGVTVGTK
jgi:hypothetical protein